MRKNNPPIENPILNLMDKRKKKLNFRYTNTDFINFDSFFQTELLETLIGKNEKVGNFVLEISKIAEVGFSHGKFQSNFSNCVENFPTHDFLNIKFSFFSSNVTQILPSQPI